MIYDVSLPLSPDLAVWPGDPPVTREEMGEHVRLSRWSLGSHAGTHVDAQTHFSAGTQTVEQLDPATLIGPCRVVDLGDAMLVTENLLAAQQLAGVERVLLRTRNSARIHEEPTHFFTDFVGLDAGAAKLMVALGVKLLGTDGFSVEPYGGGGEVHELLLGAGIILLEYLDLSAVPAGDYTLVCAPLKLAGADGAPARVFLLEQLDETLLAMRADAALQRAEWLGNDRSLQALRDIVDAKA